MNRAPRSALPARPEPIAPLTSNEWQVLGLLVRNRGGLVTHEQIGVELCLGPPESRAAAQRHVRHLRRKLGDDARRPRLIGTEPRYGYRWLPALEDGDGVDG